MIRLRLTLDISRTKPPATASDVEHEYRDNDTLVEQIGQPRYLGFRPGFIAGYRTHKKETGQ